VHEGLKKFDLLISTTKTFVAFAWDLENIKPPFMENDFWQHLQLPVSETEKQQLGQQLTKYINHLINTDFSRLVQLLYTVDVDEQKLKNVLQEQPNNDAASLIADLIMRRLQQKAQSRQQFTNQAKPDEEERW